MGTSLSLYMDKMAAPKAVKMLRKWGPEKFLKAFNNSSARLRKSLVEDVARKGWNLADLRGASSEVSPALARFLPDLEAIGKRLRADDITKFVKNKSGLSVLDKLKSVIPIDKKSVIPKKSIVRASMPGLTKKQIVRRSGGLANPNTTVFKGLYNPSGSRIRSSTVAGTPTAMRIAVPHTGSDFFMSVLPQTASDYAQGVIHGLPGVGSKSLAGVVDSMDSGKFLYKARQGYRSAGSKKPLSSIAADAWDKITSSGGSKAVEQSSLLRNVKKRKWYKDPSSIINSAMSPAEQRAAFGRGGISPNSISNMYETVGNWRPGANRTYDSRYLITGGGDAIPLNKRLTGDIVKARRGYRREAMGLLGDNKTRVKSMLKNKYIPEGVVTESLSPKITFDY